ncbi:MAG TPA: hypothetical protein VN151_10155 [Terracidiphilus sp.]|nr:hypothetical protein [Terracidiphilus sp.]
MKRTFVTLIAVLVLTASAFATPATQASTQLTKEQLKTLVANAKTPAEHERIAAYYRALSEKLLAESNAHAQMAAELASNSATNNAKVHHGTVDHCKYLAETLKAKAAKAAAQAAEHEQMAKTAAQR